MASCCDWKKPAGGRSSKSSRVSILREYCFYLSRLLSLHQVYKPRLPVATGSEGCKKAYASDLVGNLVIAILSRKGLRQVFRE